MVETAVEARCKRKRVRNNAVASIRSLITRHRAKTSDWPEKKDCGCGRLWGFINLTCHISKDTLHIHRDNIVCKVALVELDNSSDGEIKSDKIYL